MQSVRKGLLGVTLAATLVLSSAAIAADREAGPRDRGERSTIVKAIKRFIISILDDFSIPPPH